MESKCNTESKPKTVKEFFKSWYFWKPFLGVAIGGLAGFLYYFFVGCKTGTCPLTGNPVNSIITGGIFGFFITGSPCSRC